MATTQARSLLFSPLELRDVTLRNRTVVSPMCQYSATDGVANDWHLVHLGQFAMGGFALVFTEATAVVAEGRISHGDLGLWSDAQIAPLARIADHVHARGARLGVQLAHAGRKASMQRPWYGNGPLDAADTARGDLAWPIVGPTATPHGEGWLRPQALDRAGIDRIVGAFVAAAKRAHAAGADVVEIHGAHGYLLHSFLSPLANTRNDDYGGSLAGRMRVPLAVARAVRAAWPAGKPLFFRTSSIDGNAAGWSLDDTVVLARELAAIGVDVVDCSAGGFTTSRLDFGPGYLLPNAARVRAQAGMATQAVGFILTARQAEEALQRGDADLVAIGRAALMDPHWAGRAAVELEGDAGWAHWPAQYGWWLERHAALLRTF
ncbi:MAG: NADH:flavin oxidoreductase/NADH oxidase [Burkholderiales bacterium]|nr:NADH:flavin oxidoreductase/NADH oxidase [Burkholderiales bacterium]